ncbi:hypothetical protein DLAC_10088 [Tieghemostelium lacteum]|uniref:Uncharacterized protein n=1 Tax=Tieghemostelium lacteum TaxID=361077 RepID=A0A151Z6L2_TIELA|nr:hypothetical protein DLAC_10088 [Tieghemostelium lacteum]|eukprot:KYQ89424.1 hypothetical protein DLAC_10088 [Tieghemostelium lacteum]
MHLQPHQIPLGRVVIKDILDNLFSLFNHYIYDFKHLKYLVNSLSLVCHDWLYNVIPTLKIPIIQLTREDQVKYLIVWIKRRVPVKLHYSFCNDQVNLFNYSRGSINNLPILLQDNIVKLTIDSDTIFLQGYEEKFFDFIQNLKQLEEINYLNLNYPYKLTQIAEQMCIIENKWNNIKSLSAVVKPKIHDQRPLIQALARGKEQFTLSLDTTDHSYHTGWSLEYLNSFCITTLNISNFTIVPLDFIQLIKSSGYITTLNLVNVPMSGRNYDVNNIDDILREIMNSKTITNLGLDIFKSIVSYELVIEFLNENKLVQRISRFPKIARPLVATNNNNMNSTIVINNNLKQICSQFYKPYNILNCWNTDNPSSLEILDFPQLNPETMELIRIKHPNARQLSFQTIPTKNQLCETQFLPLFKIEFPNLKELFIRASLTNLVHKFVDPRSTYQIFDLLEYSQTITKLSLINIQLGDHLVHKFLESNNPKTLKTLNLSNVGLVDSLKLATSLSKNTRLLSFSIENSCTGSLPEVNYHSLIYILTNNYTLSHLGYDIHCKFENSSNLKDIVQNNQSLISLSLRMNDIYQRYDLQESLFKSLKFSTPGNFE